MNLKRLLLNLAFCAGGVTGGLIMASDAGADGQPGPVSELPHADGRVFQTLDAYLAHLEELGTIGIAWFQLRPDGMYERIMRRPPGSAPELYTRQELQEMFGFEN